MLLTPISEMTRWNNVLAYMHLDFIKRMIAMHLHKEHPDESDSERVGAKSKSRALLSHHSYPEEAQPESIHIGSETDGSVQNSGGHGRDYDSSTIGTDLRSVSWRPSATASASIDPVSLLGLQPSKMCTVLREQDRCGAGSRSVSLLQLPGGRDDPHQHQREPRRDRAGVQEV